MLRRYATRLQAFLEILGGERPLPDAWERSGLASVFIGLWWAALVGLVVAAGGRNYKFVYIDF